jgi:Methyltransferase domain/C-methyltransferase C-terminal domain
MSKGNLAMNVLRLYQQNQFPVLQNKVYSTVEEARNCTKGDIDIIQNIETGLIYNAAFRSDLMIYDENYNNEQAVSGVFQEHLNWVTQMIKYHLGKQNLIEVGCGKGFFLELLLKSGFDITGFDSTYDGTNPKIVKRYFEPGIIQSPAHGLILRHVLEHIPDPIDFLFKLKDSNRERGLIYIEVPCFDWIMKNGTWFDIFYEHINYFRIDDFRRMFGEVVECGHCFGGQYLYVVANLTTLRRPTCTEAEKVNFPVGFLKSLNIDQDKEKSSNNQKSDVVVWGGASKGVIYSLLRERMGMPVDMVVDVNPAKQGKFLPATGLRVYSPDEMLEIMNPNATVYVMNSNYLAEIKEMSNNRFNYIGVDQ